MIMSVRHNRDHRKSRGGWFAALLLLCLAHPLYAQTVVTSPGPDSVSVTVYRDPNRSGGGQIELDYLSGFALITETRTISIPEGVADIRFEGVAGGIVPVSAIVSGLPGGVIQKNRDANLLTPASLVDGSLGKRVHLKRTNRKTGLVTEEDADIISGPAGGVILKTRAGIEALGCSGLPESLSYDGVPASLTAKPTLSVTTRSPQAGTARVELSYLTSGFDWAANYIARINTDGKTLNLFAWVTLANNNAESFVNAGTQVVAGKVNRENDRYYGQAGVAALNLQCWGSRIEPPVNVTAQFRGAQRAVLYESGGEDIVVTSSRVIEEVLGDLRLYRVPQPTTVAANAQKQVVLMEKGAVPFTRLYTKQIWANQSNGLEPTSIVLRMSNKTNRGLGLAMPSGGIAVFEPEGRAQLLVGETRMRDTAVGEDVELTVGESPQVQIEVKDEDETEAEDAANIERFTVVLTNANPKPVTVEVRLNTDEDEERLEKPSAKLTRKNGQPLWIAQVPANGTSKLSYQLRDID
jgi:hypothetical protein